MELVFLNPAYLWLLASIPFLIAMHFMVSNYLKTKAWKFANFEAIKRVVGPSPSMKNFRFISKNLTLLAIQVLTITTLILSVSGAMFWYTGFAADHDFVLAIDASSSMLADDFYPNRFEAAKDSALRFVDMLSSKANVGIVSFAGTSFVEQPLTSSLSEAMLRIENLDISRAGGTDIGEALVTSSNMLVSSEKSRAIILLTDGRDTVGTSIDVGINYAYDNNVIVHTIGVATEQGGQFGATAAVSTLDEESLKRISSNTGGMYFKAASKEELDQAYREIASSAEQKISFNLQLPLMLFALALIFLQSALLNTRYRTLP